MKTTTKKTEEPPSVSDLFVELVVAALAVSEPLRRLHGTEGLELLSGSTANLADPEVIRMGVVPYAHGLRESFGTRTRPKRHPLSNAFKSIAFASTLIGRRGVSI
jgi:hypothetical protein